jgi:hypothetical protein
MKSLPSDCDNCGADVRVMATGATDEEQTLTGWVQVENGWCLDLSGGYGMFTDLALDDGSFLHNVSLCHECCLKIARALPGIFGKTGGMHSMSIDEKEASGGKSCCEFSWDSDGHGCMVYGDGHGGWTEVVAPDGTIIE